MSAPDCCGPEVRTGESRAAGDGEFLCWRSRFHRDLQLLERGAHAHHYGHHLHEPLKLAWLLSGTTTVRYRGWTWALHAGDAFLASPLEPHGGHGPARAPLSFVALYVPREALAEIRWSTVPPLPEFAVRRNALGLYRALSGQLGEADTSARQIDALASVLREFLAPGETALRCERGAIHRAVRRMRALLDEAFDEQVTVKDLARAVHLHDRYAISLFRRTIGIPPHQYLIARRLERARILLTEKVPLSTVAIAAGFADHSHFTRVFRHTYGCTPGAYRRRACR